MTSNHRTTSKASHADRIIDQASSILRYCSILHTAQNTFGIKIETSNIKKNKRCTVLLFRGYFYNLILVITKIKKLFSNNIRFILTVSHKTL